MGRTGMEWSDVTQYEIDRGDKIFFADKNKNIPRDCTAVLL